jgi:hypothetical protein
MGALPRRNAQSVCLCELWNTDIPRAHDSTNPTVLCEFSRTHFNIFLLPSCLCNFLYHWLRRTYSGSIKKLTDLIVE